MEMRVIDYMKLLKANDIAALEQYLKLYDANKEAHGQRLLHWAVLYNSLDFSKKLIEMGADVNQKDSFGRSSLSVSCFFSYIVLTRLLLKNGALIDFACMERAYYGWDGKIQTEILNLLSK